MALEPPTESPVHPPGAAAGLVDVVAASLAHDAVFSSVPLPGRLWVPYTTRAAAESVRAKPPGTRVRRGEPVTESVPQSAHAPLAPADGVIAGVQAVRLFDGRQAMAVDLVTGDTPA